jgi:hypothetical protein
VPGIGPASKAADDLRAGGEEIDDSPFAFITPLDADDKGYGHPERSF